MKKSPCKHFESKFVATDGVADRAMHALACFAGRCNILMVEVLL